MDKARAPGLTAPLVIYHANCTDGLTAAWVALQALGEAEMIAAHYGTEPPNVLGRRVYIVDFSYDRPATERLAASARELTILDHHQTAQAALDGLGDQHPNMRVVFDMTRSGARLAWDYFHPNEIAPWLVEYVEDRDLWRWALPDSRLVSAGIEAVEHTLQAWDALARRTPAAVAAEGAVIEPYRRRCIEAACALARYFTIAGYVVPTANCSEMRFASDAAHQLADGHPFAATYWIRADGMVQFSMRSRREADGLDVAAIAQRYGGGGHRHAAGFEVEFSRFAAMLAGSSDMPK